MMVNLNDNHGFRWERWANLIILITACGRSLEGVAASQPIREIFPIIFTAQLPPLFPPLKSAFY